MKIIRNFFVGIVLVIIFGSAGIYFWQKPAVYYKTPQEANTFVRFDMEAYDLILQNYWQKAGEADLAKLFQLSLQKADNLSDLPNLATSTRSGTAQMFFSTFQNATSTNAERQLAINTLIVALYNLTPTGRGSLLSSSQEKTLRQEVSNINPSNDLYQNLGLQDGASIEDVKSAYQKEKTDLEASTSPSAKTQLDQITYAEEVLTNQNSKFLYDQDKVEPTVFSRNVGTTLYLYFEKISPTTIQEFARAVDNASTTPLDSMIIDLRGNIGGSFDFAPYFFGLFVGQNQYAFDIFHQGNYDVERTTSGKFDELSRYKEIAVLADGMTQSTAEVMTAMFKRFRLATVVGQKTRGWGTIEDTFPIKTVIDPDKSYSLLIVKDLTLRDDNQPIEQNGVLPDVDIGQKNWKAQLQNHIRSTNLINAVVQTVSKPPIRF